MMRYKMDSNESKDLFRNTADLIHKKNYRTAPMRGGIRL